MPTYAVLGSTGNVGGSLIKVLLQSPQNEVHAYCRSKQKLFQNMPEIARNDNVKVFEGQLADTTLLSECLQGCQAAFLAAATTGNQPGCSIATDTAEAVVAALIELQSQKRKLPKLVVLSSASTDHSLMQAVPAIFRYLLYCAFSNLYEDLKRAEALLRRHESVVSMTFVKPGALTSDDQKGHVLDLREARSPVSFLDLAAGMIEIAQQDGQFESKSVAVNATASDVSFPRDAPIKIAKGFLTHWIPWLYRWIG